LVKPVEPARLAACVRRLEARLEPRGAAPADAEPMLEQLRALLGSAATGQPVPRLEVVQAQVGAIVHLVPVDEVVYFEAADKYVRVVTAEREHLIRMPLKDLLPRLDAQRFWQVHRGTVVQARCIRSARREESGKVTLTLAGRPETLTVSRLYASLFKGM
ncbi:MAG TPA: LytTR family DNA-binding domain-containing protein, partial [Rubrivivax sp.]|nr:LytTR family DNA-binding domain-containing protein [Rubrivivax sp.]